MSDDGFADFNRKTVLAGLRAIGNSVDTSVCNQMVCSGLRVDELKQIAIYQAAYRGNDAIYPLVGNRGNHQFIAAGDRWNDIHISQCPGYIAHADFIAAVPEGNAGTMVFQ